MNRSLFAVRISDIENEFKISAFLLLQGYFAFFKAFVIGAYVMVALMAKSRKRNIILWLLLSIIASPILIIIILFCIGDAEKIREIE